MISKLLTLLLLAGIVYADVTVSPSKTAPSGSDQQLQYNNAGSFGGTSVVYWDKGLLNLMIGGNTFASTIAAIMAQDANGDGSLAIEVSTGTESVVKGSIAGNAILDFADLSSNPKLFIGKAVSGASPDPIITVQSAPNRASFTVGIGTPTPAAMLDVNGSVKFETLTANQCVKTDASNNLVSSGGSCGGGSTTLISSGVAFGSPTNTVTQDTNTFVWDNTNKRLGIGTATPNNILDVNAGTSVGIQINQSAANYAIRMKNTVAGGDTWDVYSYSNGGLLFNDSLGTVFSIANDGTLGVHGNGISLPSGSFFYASINNSALGYSNGNNYFGGPTIFRSAAAGSATAQVDGATGNIYTLGTLGIGLVSPTSSFQDVAATANSYEALFSTSTANFHVAISTNGHIVTNSPKPSVSTCGTSPSVVGDDNQGTITVGGGVVTACTLTFASTWGITPVCIISDNSTAITGDISSLSATAMTTSFSASLGGGLVYYHCGCSGASCI